MQRDPRFQMAGAGPGPGRHGGRGQRGPVSVPGPAGGLGGRRHHDLPPPGPQAGLVARARSWADRDCSDTVTVCTGGTGPSVAGPGCR